MIHCNSSYSTHTGLVLLLLLLLLLLLRLLFFLLLLLILLLLLLLLLLFLLLLFLHFSVCDMPTTNCYLSTTNSEWLKGKTFTIYSA